MATLKSTDYIGTNKALMPYDMIQFGENNSTNLLGGMPLNTDGDTASGNSGLQGLMANIERGGQMSGIGPRIMNLDAATPQIFPPAVVVMLQTPTMWRAIGDQKNIRGKILKSLWETHARSISNIDFGYTINTQDSLVGQDSQNLSMPTNTQRSAVSPSVTWVEIYGNLVWNFHYMWLMDMNHPDTQNSYISSIMSQNRSDESYLAELPPWVVSTFSCSFMAIQPDPYGTYDRILDAALYTACFPTETGMLGIKKEVNVHEQMERTIGYKAIVMHNDNTREVGALLLKALNFHKPDYQRATTLATIDGNLNDTGANRHAAEALEAYKDMVSGNYTLQSEGSVNIANMLKTTAPEEVKTYYT